MPPTITNVVAEAQVNNATITWNTDINASSQIEYGLTTGYGEITLESNTSPRVTNHTVIMTGLVSCVRYYFRVLSKNSSGVQGVSSQYTLATSGCVTSSISGGNEALIDNISGGLVTLTTNDGTTQITAPENFTTEDTTIQLNKLDIGSIPDPPSGQVLVNDNIFDFSAVNESGTEITEFDQPLTLTITYGSNTESSFRENTLDIYKYIGNSWVDQNCSLDTNTNTLTCSLTSFSVYGVFGEKTVSSRESGQSSPPVCLDSKPAGIADLFQIDVAKTQAVLFFTPIANNKTYYISYSTKPTAEEHGVTVNLGSEGVQSLTINDLSPGTTYYFKVRGQNGCMPGDWTEIKKVTTTKTQQLTVSLPQPIKNEEEKLVQKDNLSVAIGEKEVVTGSPNKPVTWWSIVSLIANKIAGILYTIKISFLVK
jgi:hypothetical protein